ncbi:MAG: radical SAM protein [Planctomycetaceae bacterium]|nr:radical SAM protein [Planctomycetaceae bacterium]
MTVPLHKQHARTFDDNRFVYPVLSRRAKGLSIGVNLNPDKVCNFDCIYCQVDRRSEAVTKFVEMDQLLDELQAMLQLVTSGRLYDDERFASVPEHLRRLNDIAFSGDGEPTTYRNFDEIVGRAADLRDASAATDATLVLITNASMFHRPETARALEVFDSRHGEIWAKLDAGTSAHFQTVNRTKTPFARILENITDAARVRPLVIQSLFMNIDGVAPSTDEIDAYCGRLNDVFVAGGRIKLVQVYTVARTPAESFVTALEDDAVDRIASSVRARTGLPVDAYYK